MHKILKKPGSRANQSAAVGITNNTAKADFESA